MAVPPTGQSATRGRLPETGLPRSGAFRESTTSVARSANNDGPQCHVDRAVSHVEPYNLAASIRMLDSAGTRTCQLF